MPDVTTPEASAAADVRRRIAAAAERAGRDPGDVLLVAATKTVTPERIVRAGLTHAGENRVQELLQKQRVLEGMSVPAAKRIVWHFIGSLQRNKVRHIAGRVAMIHSVDDASLAREVAARVIPGAPQRVLIEVNLSGEPSKAGVAPDGLAALVGEVRSLDRIELSGLMTIPAPGDPGVAREAFRRLRELRDEHGLEHLSMGMSDDFEVAVEEGATIVRVGSAIFGVRPK